MKIDVKKYLELSQNYIKGNMGFEEIIFYKKDELTKTKIENFLITSNFSNEYINKYKDMFVKYIVISFNKNNKNLDMELIKKHNIPISEDLYELYLNKDQNIKFYIVGSKKDIKNRVVKSFFDYDFSEFLFNLAFNSLDYKLIDLPKKKIKYNWKKKELENFSIINLFAQGEYSEKVHNKICILPLFNNASLSFKYSILKKKHYIYELDGKHSEVETDIIELQRNNFLNYLDLEIDTNFLEIVFDIYKENNLFTELEFSDFIKYQEIVLKELKESSKLNSEEKKSFDKFVALIEEVENLKNGLSNNIKFNLKHKYPNYCKYL